MKAIARKGDAFRLGAVLIISVLLAMTFLVAAPERAFAASTPINPDSSAKTKQLLAYLYSLEGDHILTGQHEWLKTPHMYSNLLYANTGKYPAVHGYEMGPIEGETEAEAFAERQAMTNAAIAWSNAGGIVTMTFHQNRPGTDYCWEGCVQPGITAAEFDAILTPGTPEHDALIAEIDEVAFFLKQLRDADVPVLWRPYHEMNGGWFWWGKQERFTELWDLMYDRYTNHHELNNLIWVWTAAMPNEHADPFEAYFPGTDKVDVLAIDIYHNNYRQSYHDALWALGEGKVIAIGENGELPDLSVISTTQNKYRWFMTWGNFLVDNNTWSTINNLYNSSYAITRDEIALPADTEPPTAPANLVLTAKTATSASLAWDASADNVGVAGYEVYNGATRVNASLIAGTSYTVTGLSPSTTYTFTVKAVDAAGNPSAASNALQVTTEAGSGPGGPVFVKGINLNGGPVTIGGNPWLAESAAGLTLSPASRHTTSHTPIPAVDSDTNAMLNSVVYHNASFSIAQPIDNGSYQIYLWTMENYKSDFRSFHVKLEGDQKTTAPIGELPLYHWQRYGPFEVTVSDGVLNMELVKVKGDPLLMGMEIYTEGDGTAEPIVVNDHTTGTGLHQFEYVGTWHAAAGSGKYNGDDHWSNSANAYYQIDFVGTQISIYAALAPHHGIAAASVDGGAETDIDLYAPTRSDNALIWTSPVLPHGQHTLKVRVKGTKNSQSSGYVVAVDRVVIHP